MFDRATAIRLQRIGTPAPVILTMIPVRRYPATGVSSTGKGIRTVEHAHSSPCGKRVMESWPNCMTSPSKAWIYSVTSERHNFLERRQPRRATLKRCFSDTLRASGAALSDSTFFLSAGEPYHFRYATTLREASKHSLDSVNFTASSSHAVTDPLNCTNMSITTLWNFCLSVTASWNFNNPPANNLFLWSFCGQTWKYLNYQPGPSTLAQITGRAKVLISAATQY